MALAHSKRHKRLLLHALYTHARTHEHTRTPCMRTHSNTKAAIPFLLAADLTNHLIQNFYRALLKAVCVFNVCVCLMFVYVCLSVCNRIVCIFTFQQCFWLSDTVPSTISHCDGLGSVSITLLNFFFSFIFKVV